MAGGGKWLVALEFGAKPGGRAGRGNTDAILEMEAKRGRRVYGESIT